MKFIILLLVVGFSSSLSLIAYEGIIAPNDNNTIKINFENKTIEYPEKTPMNGDIFFVRIDDVDLKFYKIIIKKNDTIISKELDLTQLSKEFKDLSKSDQDKLEKIQNENHYISLPQQYREEFADIKIQIQPLDTGFRLSSYETSILYPKPSSSYWSVGFSFYRASLSTNEYNIKESKVDTVLQYQIVEENPLENEYGTAALIKYGGIIVEDISLGLHGTFGVGMSLNENVKPRLLVGCGFSIGRAHKFTADIGFIGGYTRTLSNAYSIDEQMLVKPENIYQEEFNSSVFIAIGYTFTL